MNYAIHHPDAFAEYMKWKSKLTEAQRQMFLEAVIAPDRDVWFIQAGDDLVNDHSGVGSTPEEAVRNFLQPFIEDILS